MSENMDIDSPNAASSRDPRLASRPIRPSILTNPSLPTTSLGSPGTPKSAILPTPTDPIPREKQDETQTPGGSFIQAVSGLVQAAVATAMSKSEKERLQKRKDTTEGLLKKAKAHTNFPSTAAFFQQAHNDENVDLTRMDDTIKEHLSNCNQIERGLMTKWGSLSPGGSKTEETTRNLQNQVQAAKADAAVAKAEIAKSVENGPSQTGPIKILQDRVALLEKALGNQSTMLNDQARNSRASDERFASLSSEMKRAATSSPAQTAIPTYIRTDIDDLRRKHTAMDSRIRSVVRFQDRTSDLLDQVSKNVEQRRRKMDDFNSQLRSLETKVAKNPIPQAANGNVDSQGILTSMELRLKTLEGKPDVPGPSSDTGNQNVQALNVRLAEMAHLQAMKDDLQFSEMEDIKKTLTQQTGEFKALKDNYSQVSEEIKNIAQANPAAALQQVQGLSGSLLTTQRVVESVKIALHSLETRYNNISTEPIVKNMVVAMQEMYPSASQLTEQVSILRTHFEKELIPLKSKVESMIRAHGSHVTQAQKDAALRLEEINKLKADHMRIDQSLADLRERPNAQGSWPNQQQTNKVQSNIESLSKKLDEHVSKVNEQLSTKQTSDGSLVQSLNNEREHLNKELRGISSELKSLISRFGKVETANTDNVEATKTQWNEIGSLLDRMRHLEESASSNHAQLLEQFDNIKKAVESQEAGSLDGRGLENGALSPLQKVEEEEEEEEEQEECTETPSNGGNGDSTVNSLAETNPALALREKKKKKRPRPSNLSNLSDDERQPGSRPESRSDSPRVSTPGREGTPSTENKRRTKKKKKRRLQQDLETITLD